MSNQLFRLTFRAMKVPQRALGTTPINSRNVVLDQKLRDEVHPQLGKLHEYVCDIR